VQTPFRGLTTQEVNARVARGEVNTPPRGLTRTIPRILRDNTLTLFNVLMLTLFVLVMLAGEYKNGLFFLVALANVIIGSAQEIRAKITIDRLSVITQTHVCVIRDGREQSISQEQVVLGDTLVLATGNQVCADSVVVARQGLELDESLLTGESHSVKKAPGDTVFSGSFVVAGSGFVEVAAVGKDSYAHAISAQSKYEKQSNSQLMRTINFIIKSLTFALIPLGAALFVREYFSLHEYSATLLKTTAACIGMIPAGLVLLTSVAFAIGALNLVRHKTLTQSMPSIETLARIDTLCLDKTGTITDGKLSVQEVVPLGASLEETEAALGELSATMADKSETELALRQRFLPRGTWAASQAVAFSSARKWSAQGFTEQGTFVLGAPEIVLPQMSAGLKEQIASYSQRGLRVMLVAHTHAAILEEELPEGLTAFALLVLADHVRESAPETFEFFREDGVDIKVISGDDPQTVSTIAAMAGIENPERFVDMSKMSSGDSYEDLMDRYTVFGRTSPDQKREMIQALKKNNKMVAMTGDGVNDAMALREADVSVAMASGSDAARTVADFVLIDSDFSAMVQVVREGRRVVNNIESVASLYIVKTIYSVLLTILFIILSFGYPFQPIQLTFLNFFMVGVPSMFLALEPNYHAMRDQFIHRLVGNAVPAALLIVLYIITIQLIGNFVPLAFEEISTLSVLFNGTVCIILLLRVCRPFTTFKIILSSVLIACFVCVFIFFGDFFELVWVLNELALLWVPLVIMAYPIYRALEWVVVRIESRWLARQHRVKTPA
jgi:cation-transporting ATPase E